MARPQVFTGDDWVLAIPLTRNGATFDMSAGSVQAAVVSRADSAAEVLIPSTEMSAAEPGADWANSLVVVNFPAAATAAVTTYGDRFIELQVTLGGKKTTWNRIPIIINKGLIA